MSSKPIAANVQSRATSSRVRWLGQGSVTALALGLCFGAGAEAQAQTRPQVAPRESATQAVQGTPTFQPGTSFGTRTANSDQIVVTTNSTIINWTTLDTRTIDQTTNFIDFLPTGTTLSFVGPGSEFNVLNRIIPTANAAGKYRGISLDGTVNSFIGASQPQGGSIWFYSPGGILVGSNSAFNVGSLAFTTSDLTYSVGAFGSSLYFNGVSDPFSQVFIDAGAQITLPNEGSYLVAFAPSIVQAGNVNVNGQVTYASGETGIAFLDGFGNVGVSVSADAQPGNFIIHTGTTTGPASTGVLDDHVITFLAPGPGLEVLLSGAIGYAEPNAVSVDPNGRIEIFADSVEFGAGQVDSAVNLFSNDVLNVAVSGIGNDLVFGSATNAVDVTFSANNAVNLSATAGASINVSGNLGISAGTVGQGGDITITVDDAGRDSAAIVSGLIVGGNLTVGVGAVGDYDPDMGQGGDAFGGNLAVSVSQGGDIAVGGNASFVATGRGGYGNYRSGNGQGGSIGLTMTGANSAISVGGTLDITSAGLSSVNPQNGYAYTDSAGSTTGGSIDLVLTEGTLNVASLTLDASATGTDSFGFNPGTYQGYSGGNATGGSVTMTTGPGASINIGSLTLDASARGGRGADQGASSGSAVGGLGGDAQGGTATLNNNGGLAVVDLTIVANAFAGDGGAGTNSTGGTGTGGSATLNSAATIVGLDTLGIDAAGFGGNGGASQYFGTAYSGGNGGDGFGGNMRLELTGTGTTMQGLSIMSLDAGGVGGSGAAGAYGFGAGSAGAAGGNGQGGTLEVVAGSGTTFEFAASVDSFRASGMGGDGGFGGDSYGTAGDGGAGGTGQGGTLRMTAQGGTITGADLDITNAGIGGTGGIGGYNIGPGTNAAYGANGAGTGGVVELATVDGSPGIITLGAVTIDASGIAGGADITIPTTGGSISITDGSVDPAGLITLGSLTATALGTTGAAGDFTMSGDSGAITILGTLNVNVARDASFNFDGDGQVTIGASTTLTAGRDVLVTHTNNRGGTFTIDSTDDFVIRAGRDFLSTPDSILVGRLDIDLRAENAVTANDLRAIRRLILESGGNFTLNNASIFGPTDTSPDGSGGFLINNGILLGAGVDLSGLYDPNANLTITGDVTSTGFIAMAAGGTATFAGGSTTISDNGLQVLTGDDIIVASGALVEAAANPANTPDLLNPFASAQNLVLFAGGLTGSLTGPTPTPISSIVIDGTVDSNTFATILVADAIDALDGTLLGSSLQADILNAPASGSPQSDDNGLLAAQCVEGNVCIGTIGADNIVAIGQNSPNDVIAFTGGQGGVTSAQFLLTTRDSITIGSAGSPSTIGGTGQVVIESLGGDVNILDTTLNSDQILITAAGSLLGTGSLVSANDIGVTVGGDFNAVLVDTGGQLTTVAGVGGALEADYSVPGSIIIGDLVQDAAGPASFTAGGDISFGSITTLGQPIALTAANGSAFLGTTTQAGAGSVTITAQDVTYTDLAAAGAITLTSTVGGISGNSLSAGTTLDLNSATDVATTDLTSGGAMTLDATGAISFGVATSGASIAMTSGGNVSGTSVDATTDLDVAAGGTAVFGLLRQRTAGFLASVTATDITIGSIETASPLDLTATTGGIAIANPLATASTVTLDAATNISLAGVDAAQLDAVAGGGITSSGPITTSGATNLTAGTGGITLSNLTAANGSVTATGGAVNLSGADVAGQLAVFGTSVTVTAPGALDINATATAGGIDVTAATDLVVSNAQATGAVSLTSGGLLTINGIASGATVDTLSADLDIATGAVLGGAGTNAVTIVSNGTSAMTLGGAGGAGGFELTADEVSRIFSVGDLTIRAFDPGTGATALVVDDVTFNTFSPASPGQFGIGGTLLIDTDGDALVGGSLLVNGADATTQLQIVTGGSIRIDAAVGNLAMTDFAGAFSGSMLLTAQDIYAMTDAAFADIQGMTLAEIDARLALNDGIDRPDGMIQADALTIETTASQVFIQNTAPGTDFVDRRGFVVGSLTLNDTAGTTQPIVINGIIGTAIGIDAIPAAQINSTYDLDSTINGCLIRDPVNCGVAPRPDVIPEDVQTLIGEEIIDNLGDEVNKLVPGSMIIDLAEQEEFRKDPLIDEPVTGAGNDDLWIGELDCESEDEENRDPACPLSADEFEPAE